jgi:hypothetical protein
LLHRFGLESDPGLNVPMSLQPAEYNLILQSLFQKIDSFCREHLDRQENAVSDGYTDGQFVDMLTMMLEDVAMHFLDKNDNKVY